MKLSHRWIRGVVGVIVAALGVFAPAGVHVMSAGAAAPAAVLAATATVPPWEPDNGATFGGIDFYNSAGQQITGGSVTSAPMAAYAVAQHTSTGATKATLFGYLPKSGQNTPVGGGFDDAFQGEQMSDSTIFPNATAASGIASLSNPVVTELSSDETLQALETSRPNTDTSADGFAGMYQLRIKLSSPTGVVAGYASTDIQITGTTWTQVFGSFASPVSGGSGPVPTTTVVTASPVSPVTAGTSVTFTATVSPTAAGMVQFVNDGSNLGSAVPVSGGTATSAATTALTTASHSITAVFTPTDSSAFAASTSPAITYVVNASGGSGPVPTTTVVTASPVSPVTAGTSVTFTATVSPTAAGMVQFVNDGSNLGSAVPVSGGTATSAATTALTTASHSITAVFTPTDSSAFAASTSPAITYVVNASGGSGPVPTTTAVTASPVSPVTAGTSVTFTATVSPTAAGMVQFVNDGSNLGSAVPVSGGTATSAATTALTTASHSITAVFTPTDSSAFAASTSPAITYVVNASGAVTTTTALAVSPASPTTAGTSVTFTATVSPSSAAGSVQFLVGATHLGNAVAVSSGSAVLATTALPQGTDSITAAFTPTDATAFTTSTSSALSYVVNQSLTALTTTTALAVSPATTAATGAVVQLTATVTCTATCTPAGSVTFWDGGSVQIGSAVTVASGSATVSTSTLSIGSTHSFVAKFTPTDATVFAMSQSAAVPYTITSTDSGTATVTSSSGADLGTDPTLTPGQSVTVVAGGFTAGETVTATVHSVPQTLTPTTASTTGTISYVLVVPADLPAGAHSLVLAGATSSHTVTINFTVGSTSTLTDPAPTVAGAASLPFTGANVELMSVIALLCICAGFVIRFGGHEPRRTGAHVRTGPRHAR